MIKNETIQSLFTRKITNFYIGVKTMGNTVHQSK